MPAPGLFHLGGLLFRSELPLPGFPAAGGEPEVTVVRGRVPARLEAPRAEAARFQAAPGRCLFTPESGFRILACDGTRVTVDLEPGGSLKTLGRFFDHPVLGALLLQRGLLPLHASAIRGPDGAWLFAGNRLAGKSSMAALLRARGLQPLCDDVSPVDGEARLLGGFPFLKLPVELAAEPGEDLREPGRHRRRVRVAEEPTGPVPIRRLWTLEPEPGARGVTCTLLPPPRALELLFGYTYRRSLVPALGVAARRMQLAARLAAAVGVRMVTCPPGPDGLRRVADRILEEAG